MKFFLYNTLSRRKEEFLPLARGQVDFYSCGPTVYNIIHIGNLRAFIAADTLFRFLRFGLGHTVRWVMNVTDVDDKTIRDSQTAYPDLEPKEALHRFTRHYEELFFRDLAQLNIEKESFFANPRATDSIPTMQDLIRKIHTAGYAYVKEGSIYLSLEKYTEKHKYGRLVTIDPAALQSGRRTLADEIEKENVQDFVLWKAQKPGEPAWDFDFSGQNLPGRPGWHIECSAMEMAVFGKLPFDIHSGGVDLEFPHHEDEIAQSIAGYGIEPTKYWIHNEHLMVEGQKMSKSSGNFYTLQDLMEKGHSADTVRFFLVSNHYRTKLNLTEKALRSAAAALHRIRNALQAWKKAPDNGMGEDIGALRQKFLEAMADDLNTPQAVAILFEVLAAVNPQKEQVIEFFKLAEDLLGLRLFPEITAIPVEVDELATARKQAKQDKNYAKADRLRAEILARGYEIRDEGDNYELLPRKL